MITISNWYCPKCKRLLSSEDIDRREVHRECQEKAVWQRQKIKSLEECGE